MLDLKAIFEEVLEDMMLGGGEGAAAGADNSIQTSDCTTSNDVLGTNCNHPKDGYLGGAGCFHVPSTVCKMKREIQSGKKKKNQKNPYSDNMKVLSEED